MARNMYLLSCFVARRSNEQGRMKNSDRRVEISFHGGAKQSQKSAEVANGVNQTQTANHFSKPS